MTSRRKLTMPCPDHNLVSLMVSKGAIGRYILALLLSAGLAGCAGDEAGDLREYVATVKTQKKSTIPPLPKPLSYDTFVYNDSSLRDPYVPSITIISPNGRNNELQPDLKRERDILEQYALGSLKMVGSLEKDGKRWALMHAPDNTVHRATIGNHMGQNNGQIIRVTETEVELREIVPDGLGGWVERKTTLNVTQ